MNISMLIVNQNTLFLEKLQNAFEAEGYKVIVTTNSLMIKPLFLQHKPQAIILEICMPEKDGFEMVKEIRAVCQKTLIFAVSSNYLHLRMIRILGATRAFCKSTDISMIVNIIKFSLPL